MNSVKKPYYGNTLLLLSVFGVNPYQNTPSRFAGVFVYCGIACTQLIFKIAFVAQKWPDIDVFIRQTPPILVDFISIFKIINCAVNVKKVKQLFDQVLFSSDPLLSYEELDMIERHDEHCRKFTIVWFTYLVSAATIFYAMPLIQHVLDPLGNNTNQEPLPVYYYRFDVQEYYYPIYAHAFVTAWMFMGSLVAADSMYVVFVENACAMFSLVSHRLQKAVPANQKYTDAGAQKYNDPAYNNFIDCIKRHKAAIKLVEPNELFSITTARLWNLLPNANKVNCIQIFILYKNIVSIGFPGQRFADEVESTFSVSFLLTVGTNMIIISFTGTQLAEAVGEFDHLARHGAMIFAQMGHLYMENYYAQKLSDYSCDVYTKIWNSNWENTSLRTQKLLVVFIMRSLQPSVITIGGFYVMSIDTFNWLLRTSASYFTLLRSFQ